MKLSKRSNQGETPQAPRPPKPRRASRADGGGSKTKNKGSHFVLMLGDDGAILIFLQGNTVVRRLFAPSPRPDHTASIVELMRANPTVPLSILADVIDQQYVRHNFPPVSSFSVNNLVKRRMERDFQAEDLKNFMRLGREKTGRKEWSYLLVALANTPLMQQWLELLVELPNEMKGIFLTPLEGQHYIPALKRHIGSMAMPWQLLLTHNKVSGFRQIVLQDSKLVFTRVTQAIDDGVAAVLAGNIEQEIISTMEYLRRLGFQDNDSLEIIVIAAQEVKEALDLARFRVGGQHVLTPLDVADMMGLQQAALSADRFGDVVFASWFATSKKRVRRFNSAYGEKLTKLYGARRAIKLIGGLLIVGMLGLAAFNVKDMFALSSETAAIESQNAPQLSEIANLQKSIDSLDKDVALKSAIVGVHAAYMKDAKSPLDFAREYSRYSDPLFRVQSMDWGSTPVKPAQGAAATTTETLKVTLGIEVMGSYSDVETLTNAAEAFIDRLQSNMPSYEIKAEPFSWSKDSADSMEISFGQNAAGAANAIGDRKITLTFTEKPATASTGAVNPMPPGM